MNKSLSSLLPSKDIGGLSDKDGITFVGTRYKAVGKHIEGKEDINDLPIKYWKLKQSINKIPLLRGIFLHDGWGIAIFYYGIMFTALFTAKIYFNSLTNLTVRLITLLLIYAFVSASLLIQAFHPEHKLIKEYHAAEHMALNHYTKTGKSTDIKSIGESSPLTPRCGSFLTIALLFVATVITFLPIPLYIKSILIPALAYEIHRNSTNKIIRPFTNFFLYPQKLTIAETSEDKIKLAAKTLSLLLEKEKGT